MGKKHDGVYLDSDSLDIFRYIWRHDRADTRDVTHSNDVAVTDNDRARYRMKKLATAGLVELSTADYSAGGSPPTVASITNRGEQAVSRGLLGNIQDSEVDSSSVERDRLEKRIETLEDDVDELTEILATFARALGDNGIDPREYLKDAK